MRVKLTIAVLAWLASVAATPPPVGRTSELVLTRDRAEQRSDGGSSSSHDRDTVIERVVAVRPDGVELVYDLPDTTPSEQRQSTWLFPIHLLRPALGPARLLDGDAVVARISAWLAAAKLPRSGCGQWVFTWNAFRIDCDPASALATAAAFDLGGDDVREGVSYHANDALSSVPLARDGTRLTATLPLDPERVRGERAQADVVIGAILHKPITEEAALAAHAGEAISGTIAVTFDLDVAGAAIRRKTRVETHIVRTDGVVETATVDEVLERRPLPNRRY